MSDERSIAESSRVSRRDFLWYSLSTGMVVWAGSFAGEAHAEERALFRVSNKRPASEVFPQSVASGDPRSNGIVLWTRVLPEVARRCARRGVSKVAYEISRTEDFSKPLLRGFASTSASRDYTVKIQLSRAELRPQTTYYYRFIIAGTASRKGRFKTLPARGANLNRLRLGYTSCQDYTNGYFNALRFLANEEIDYVVHLGDYIYETVSDPSFQGGGPPERQIARLPSGRPQAETLADYRFLYRKYKSDRDLQKLHERFAMINIWDDHEFANDCYQTFDSDTENEASNRDPQRRQDANRAWAEFLPAGVPYDPAKGPLEEIRIYRSFAFGNLAELVMTDERLYRDGPPCGLATTDKAATPGCPVSSSKGGEENENRTMLGATQKEWFLDRMTTSRARWKVWGNETMFMQFKVLNADVIGLLEGNTIPIFDGAPLDPDTLDPDGSIYVNLDQWDGYQAERREITAAIKDADVENFITITGDLHTFLAGYTKLDYNADPTNTDAANLAGVCFMAGSVTSSNLEELAARSGSSGNQLDLSALFTAANPHIEYFNSSTHGYNIIEMNRQELVCTMKNVGSVRTPETTIDTLGTFRVPAGEVSLEGSIVP